MLRGEHTLVPRLNVGQARGVLGVVGTQGGVVVAEAVVRPPGFRILVLIGKQQRASTPTRPSAFAVQRLGGVFLHGFRW